MLGIPAEALRWRVHELGREVGVPWRQDQKDSATAAWLALVT